MAARDIAGRRYASAVMEIARADDAVDSWLEAVEALDALTSQSAYVDALQADGLTDDQFQAIVRRVYPEANEKQMNLFRLLRRKTRLTLGPSIAAFFREMVDEERGILRATLITAVELDEERRRQVQERLHEQTGRHILVDEQVDPTLLGGMVVRIGDRLIDGSARTRLRDLRSRLEQVAIV